MLSYKHSDCTIMQQLAFWKYQGIHYVYEGRMGFSLQ